QRVDGDPNWFRYHQLFAEFLRRRIERDDPDRIQWLHRAASQWFTDHAYVNEAVDHALAAGDPHGALDLVEQDETKLLEQSKMTTLLRVVNKLPSQLVVSRPRLQLHIAWANVLLQRPDRASAALDRFEAALRRAGTSVSEGSDLRAEANVVRAVAAMFADRLQSLDDLIAEALSRPDSLPPRVAGVAGIVAAFAAIYRFDFGAAHRHLQWAAPYQEMMRPFARVYARCFGGIAARQQLDVPAALKNFRAALEIAATVGPHSHAVRLAGALLGELLYETGELNEAERRLDESYRLGSDGGGVDYLAARYLTCARIKAAQGDRACGRAANGRDGGGAAVEAARLAAAITNERIRLGFEIAPAVAARLRSPRTTARDDGIATFTAELDENSGIRLLSSSDSADERDQACRRAAELLGGINAARRPLAALGAHILLAQTLAATGRPADTDVAVRCTKLGLPGLLADTGLG
ncbi:MAG: serine/threonine-protein kinase PknK, partial [Mycolicibacterium sp.]|nr:serine/threonine-protein kinase PknK [Mycolicibacterium sp.]